MKKNLPIFEISQEALNFSVTLISCLQKMIQVSFDLKQSLDYFDDMNLNSVLTAGAQYDCFVSNSFASVEAFFMHNRGSAQVGVQLETPQAGCCSNGFIVNVQIQRYTSQLHLGAAADSHINTADGLGWGHQHCYHAYHQLCTYSEIICCHQ